MDSRPQVLRPAETTCSGPSAGKPSTRRCGYPDGPMECGVLSLAQYARRTRSELEELLRYCDLERRVIGVVSGTKASTTFDSFGGHPHEWANSEPMESLSPEFAAHRRGLHVHHTRHPEVVRVAGPRAAESGAAAVPVRRGRRAGGRRRVATLPGLVHPAGRLSPVRRDGGRLLHGACVPELLARPERGARSWCSSASSGCSWPPPGPAPGVSMRFAGRRPRRVRPCRGEVAGSDSSWASASSSSARRRLRGRSS